MCVAGDRFEPLALARMVAHFARNPDHAVVYGDELRIGGSGGLVPVFKPDWSPTRQAFAPYVGRTGMIRADRFPDLAVTETAPDDLLGLAIAACHAAAVGHLRRFVVTVPAPDRVSAEPTRVSALGPSRPSIGIVIPTRDRLDLLQPCVDSVLAITAYSDFRIAIVDNGSSKPETLSWFDTISRGDRRVEVLRKDGPFNFSALSNLGAEHLSTDLILFLNNDTVVLDADWLDNLAAFAIQPEIGAVGAKLLYPDGTVQHVGVSMGVGGVAGHSGEGLPTYAPGWLSSNLVPHEVSAVTGACLLVERSKFQAVGGFDALNLPIELNDVDLCLRLGERGWRTICDCRTRLTHHQSASRGGAGLRLQKVYAKERAYFVERWRHVIRDDPYFNPTLSLYALEPRLA